MRRSLTSILTTTALVMLGCSSTPQFVPIPEDLDRSTVRAQTVAIEAKRYEFTPEVVRVKAGTLVTLRITAVDGVHGFALGSFGIDERIGEGETKVIEFYASKPGEYGFHCSHFCGMGHFGMTGKVVVE